MRPLLLSGLLCGRALHCVRLKHTVYFPSLSISTFVHSCIRKSWDTRTTRLYATQPPSRRVLTIPNALCLSRILLVAPISYLVIIQNHQIALILFLLAAVTDLLDGFIARNFASQQSAIGSALDPFADKLLIGSLFCTLTFTQQIPFALFWLVLSRDILLICSGLYYRYITLPHPTSITRFFDYNNPTFTMHPTTLSKINTLVQVLYVATTLAAPVFQYQNHFMLDYFSYVTAVSTIISGMSYVFAKNTVTIIKKVPKDTVTVYKKEPKI